MYSSVVDVRNALTPGASSTDVGTAASLGNSQIEDAIQQADAKIDEYVPSGYTVPMQNVQQGEPLAPVSVAVSPIRWWSRDIAAYLATLTFKRNQDVSPDDPVRLRFNLAMQSLTAVRDGDINLPPDANSGDDTAGDVFVHNHYTGTLFGTSDFDLSPAGYPIDGHERWGWW